MPGNRFLDLVCVSYLADAQILRVTAYPPANHGAVVHETVSSIAADGPLVAPTAVSLGLRVGLIANQVGDDPAGWRLTDWLTAVGVRHAIRPDPNKCTPRLTVVTDEAGTRTWFAYLNDAYAQLHAADLSLLNQARLVYIDCYRVLGPAAARAVAAAGETPLLINLGGDPPDATLAAATSGRRIAAVQTSLDETAADDGEDLATTLYRQLRPAAAVVTLGRLGALARTRIGLHRSEAATITVRHTHGAGAAFSAGYAHALLAGLDVDAALQAGCVTGTNYCASATSLPYPAE